MRLGEGTFGRILPAIRARRTRLAEGELWTYPDWPFRSFLQRGWNTFDVFVFLSLVVGGIKILLIVFSDWHLYAGHPFVKPWLHNARRLIAAGVNSKPLDFKDLSPRLYTNDWVDLVATILVVPLAYALVYRFWRNLADTIDSFVANKVLVLKDHGQHLKDECKKTFSPPRLRALSLLGSVALVSLSWVYVNRATQGSWWASARISSMLLYISYFSLALFQTTIYPLCKYWRVGEFSKKAFAQEVKLVPGHPDQCGGLSPLGDLFLTSLSIQLLLFPLVATIAFSAYWPAHVVADIFIPYALVLLPVFVYRSLRPVHLSIVRTKMRMLAGSERWMRDLCETIESALYDASRDPESVASLMQRLELAGKYRSSIFSVRALPLRTFQLSYGFSSTAVSYLTFAWHVAKIGHP